MKTIEPRWYVAEVRGVRILAQVDDEDRYVRFMWGSAPALRSDSLQGANVVGSGNKLFGIFSELCDRIAMAPWIRQGVASGR